MQQGKMHSFYVTYKIHIVVVKLSIYCDSGIAFQKWKTLQPSNSFDYITIVHESTSCPNSLFCVIQYLLEDSQHPSNVTGRPVFETICYTLKWFVCWQFDFFHLVVQYMFSIRWRKMYINAYKCIYIYIHTTALE